MEEILAIAKQLGDAVKASERCAALRSASEAFQADADAQALRDEYDAAVTAVQEKTARNAPLEPEEKRAEADLRAKVAVNPTILSLLRAQADFHELMNAINDTVQKTIDL